MIDHRNPRPDRGTDSAPPRHGHVTTNLQTAAGKTITAKFRAPGSGIIGALAEDNQPWIEVSLAGVAQAPRQKLLTVPFSIRSLISSDTACYNQLEKLVKSFAQTSGINVTNITSRINSTGDELGVFHKTNWSTPRVLSGGIDTRSVYDYDLGLNGKKVLSTILAITNHASNFGGFIEYVYSDNSTQKYSWNSFINNGAIRYDNPNSSKNVRRIRLTNGVQDGGGGPYSEVAGISFYTTEPASITFKPTNSIMAKGVYVLPQASGSLPANKSVVILDSSGNRFSGNWDSWIEMSGPTPAQLSEITITGEVESVGSSINIPSIKIIYY